MLHGIIICDSQIDPGQTIFIDIESRHMRCDF